MENLLLIGATLCLLCSFGYTLSRLRARSVQPGKFNLTALIGAFAFLSMNLWLRGQQQRSCPINSLFDIIIFLSWGIILIYFIVGSGYRLSLLGAFTSPLVLTLLVSAQIFPLAHDAAVHAPRSPWVEFHASLSIISYSAFALAGVAGAMYLLQDRQLKTRKGGALLYSLPPITDLGVANTRLIWLGLILLTISFAAGFVSGMKIDTLKFYTSATIWAAYSALVFLRQIHTLAPRRTAILSLAAFTFILVTLPVIQHLSIPK